MQVCCNWAWQTWPRELVAPVDFTGEQQPSGQLLFSGEVGETALSVGSVILAFCKLKVCKLPEEWAEGAAVAQSGAEGPLACLQPLGGEGWGSRAGCISALPSSLVVPLHASFWGFYQTKSLYQGDVLLLSGREQKNCEKGGLKAYGATSRGNHRRWKFFTVASSETKS